MSKRELGKDYTVSVLAKVKEKKNPVALSKLCFKSYAEGKSAQLLHIGSYDDEAPKLMNLRDIYMPEHSYSFHGHHHKIYLSDPRKVAPEKLKTVLRQTIL